MLARRHLGERKPVALQAQRRLSPNQVDDLVAMYTSGSSVPIVAESFGINRETVLIHLERRGVARRAKVRKLSDEDVKVAAKLYGAGDSMASLTTRFGVDAKTLLRELRAAGVPIRKPGRPAVAPVMTTTNHVTPPSYGYFRG
jgi:transposase-like protein